jgi:hypothetical protein
MSENIKVIVERSDMVSIADAVRNKTGRSDEMTVDQLITGINNISSIAEEIELQSKTITPTTSKQTVTADIGYDGLGTVIVDAIPTAARAETTISVTADDINDKLILIASNNQSTGYVTGTNKTASKTISLTANGATVTASDGTHSISTTIPAVAQAMPSISIDDNGLITATSSQDSGYVTEGTRTAYQQLNIKGTTTITPTKSSKVVVDSGTYTTGNITVGAIPDAYITTTDATAVAGEIFEGESAYVNGSKVTGTFTIEEELSEQDNLLVQIENALKGKAIEGGETPSINLQEKTIIPTNSNQTVTADSGYDGLDTVTVEAIPDSYVQPTSTKVATTYTPSTTDQIIASGTYLAGDQTIKGDSNLVASNIKSGVSIFGINGTLEEGSGGTSGYTLDQFNEATIEGALVVNGTKVRSYAFYNFRNATSISAPNATTIEQYAFGYCINVTSVYLPEVTSVTNGSLRNLHALTSIVLPKVTTIAGYGMYYMIAATKIDLPVCTSLDTYSLGYCNKLEHLILRSNTVCTLKNVNCFFSTPFQSGKAGGYVYVPSTLISDYQSATNWSGLAVTFRAIEDYPDICG